jgi:hypothetical protein
MFYCFTIIIFFVFSCSTDKRKLLQKKWIATKVKIGEQVVNADVLGGVSIDFREDKTFTTTWGTDTKTGQWELANDGNKIVLIIQPDNRTQEQTIKTLSDDSLTVEFTENELARTVQYAAAPN